MVARQHFLKADPCGADVTQVLPTSWAALDKSSCALQAGTKPEVDSSFCLALSTGENNLLASLGSLHVPHPAKLSTALWTTH